MIRAIDVIPAGKWQGPVFDTIVLDFDARHRRRIAMTASGGTTFLLDLSEAVAIADGSALKLEDGRLVTVTAATERLLEISCASSTDLNRVAWHLGNRHLPTEIHGDTLLVRYDHVIADMLRGMGVTVKEISAPFHPESGAYGERHRHD